MSVIYSFLQKRKMHENQFGFVMVFTAYILSALMLALGSDVFYNINSEAAQISSDTKEETQNLLSINLPGMQLADNAKQIFGTELINPYGLKDNKDELTNDTTSNNLSESDDTVWFLGNAMDEEDFNSLMVQVGDLEAVSNASEAKKQDKADKNAFEATEVETVSTINGKVTLKEVKMLERIVEAEASGEDMEGKILVANVILNRVADEHFPDTIQGVIFQEKNGEYQFSPVANKRYWSVEVSDKTKKAVKKALQGEDFSKGALYFIARKRANSNSAEWFDEHLDWLFKHGGHEFYKNK